MKEQLVIKKNKNHIKKSFHKISIFIITILFTGVLGLQAYGSQGIGIFINEEQLFFDVEPIIVNGRTLVPFRGIFEALELDVSWDNTNRIAYGRRKDTPFEIGIKIDSNTATITDYQGITKTYTMDTKAIIQKGRTLVPLRFIAEATGADVAWDNATKSVLITIKQGDDGSGKNKDKLSIVWHLTTNRFSNTHIEELMEHTVGVDVISPTWFQVDNSEGDITSNANKEYVEWAHENGYKVWALFSNQFTKQEMTHDVLADRNKRKKMIDTVVNYAKEYNIDGINIDFEGVAKEDGENYVQFIKECGQAFSSANLVSSVDCYVPSVWTKHYNRKEIANYVDYIIIMAYDEHHATSQVSGSVASIGFVEKGVEDTLKEVPEEKVIVGIPFYTRIWTEVVEDNQTKVYSKSLTMNEAYTYIKENNATVTWLEDLGQYYAQYEKEGKTYKIWLEEERSITKKLETIEKYQLAGAAAWRIGHEKEEIWDVMEEFLP